MEESFGDRIRSLRRSKNFTLKELSEKSRIELTYLSKIENDKTGKPEVGTINKLADAFEVDTDTKLELFRLAGQIPPDFEETITKSKAMYEVYRTTKGFTEEELLLIVEEIKKRKREKDEKNMEK